MIATYESVMNFALQLPPAERSRVASNLWESIRNVEREEVSDLDALLDQREAEMESDCGMVLSLDEFLAHFKSNQRL
jgi:hypothetical protein